MDNNTEKDLEQTKTEEVEFVSYSHIDENGVFHETYGYNMENKAEEFFKNLSEEELDKIRRH